MCYILKHIKYLHATQYTKTNQLISLEYKAGLLQWKKHSSVEILQDRKWLMQDTCLEEIAGSMWH